VEFASALKFVCLDRSLGSTHGLLFLTRFVGNGICALTVGYAFHNGQVIV